MSDAENGDKVLKVAAAGLRLGRLPGGPAADRAGRRPGRPGRCAGRAGRRRRTPPRRAARGRRAGRPAHHRRRRPGHARRRRPGGRGDRRHRAGPVADPGRAGERRLASSPPTRRCSPRTARRCSRRPRRPAATSTTRPSVAGAIPILRPLRESLAGDRVTRVLGIVNGTTNFILDQMDTTGAGFAEALEEAQELGYAEADPTADVEGFDAAAKAAILASLAFHTRVTAADVLPRGHHRGHRGRRRSPPARWARVVKLLAICERSSDGAVSRPRAPGDDPALATRWPRVREAFNAVFVESEAAGQLMFYGPGAGGAPTASRGARRPGHRRPQPARGHPRPRRVVVRRPRGAADGRDPHPLPRRHRRRRPRRRARRGRHGVRRARRVDPDRAPGGPRRRRPARRRLPPAPPTPRWPPPSSTCAAWTSSARSPRSCGSRATAEMTDPRPHQWRGVIEEYRDLLDLPDGTPAVTPR